jgi:hypothetical protein
MASDEQITSRDMAAGVELIERLLEAADGGRKIGLGEYQASTILAMLDDPGYRNSVLAAHSATPPN